MVEIQSYPKVGKLSNWLIKFNKGQKLKQSKTWKNSKILHSNDKIWFMLKVFKINMENFGSTSAILEFSEISINCGNLGNFF